MLEAMQGPPPSIPRREYLIEAFGQRIDFAHRRVAYSYVPTFTVEGNVVVGRVGRPGISHVVGPPDTAFAPVDQPGFVAANIYLDANDDPDGQKLAIQLNTGVGAVLPLVTALIQRINDIGVDAAWLIEVYPISDEESFWSVVEKYRSEITSLQLKLVAPNILGFRDSVSQEMRRVRDENNAATVTIGIENKDGINVDTKEVREAVHYVSEGGGDAILRKGRRKLFDSKRRTRTINVDDDAAATPENSGIIITVIKRIFGR